MSCNSPSLVFVLLSADVVRYNAAHDMFTLALSTICYKVAAGMDCGDAILDMLSDQVISAHHLPLKLTLKDSEISRLSAVRFALFRSLWR